MYDDWEPLDLTSNACAIYVNTGGMFKCTVDEKDYLFQVCGEYFLILCNRLVM